MDLKGKKILFLGSSVTEGASSGGTCFVEFVSEHYGADYIKAALSGTTLADINEKSYVSRLKMVDVREKVDLFVCQLSTNDATKKIDLIEVEKAISFIIDYVSEHFSCPMVFYTGTKYESPEYLKMVELLYDMKNRYDFYILDLYNDEEMCGVSDENYKKYMRDPIHPTLIGYKEWWTPKFIEFIDKLPTYSK